MLDLEAVEIAENMDPDPDNERCMEAWQHLVTTGLAWTLQGFFGRTAATLIEAGHVTTGQS